MDQFTYVKRGYDPGEVDRHIANLDHIIKNYKENDNAIKNAILSAQVAADNMIKNARAQANEYKVHIVREVEKARQELERQRQKLETFRSIYANLINTYLREINNNDMDELTRHLNDLDSMFEKLMDDNMVVPPTGPV